MVVRRRRKKNKVRGNRTHGKGDTKNRRGAGSRGGRGRAGSHKHKFTKYYGEFGTEKKKLREKTTVNAINLDQLQQQLPKMLAEKKAVKEGNSIVIDGNKIGFGKILSMGNLKEKLVARNIRASKKAMEKIEKAGGKVEQPAAETPGEDSEVAGENGEGPEKESAKEEKGKETEKKGKRGTD
ncbi:MAG: uL15 family ribosomal protein [Candidatus Diapherotrites archaeon]|uniref:Large ribosomal subunit protein uL15 n=1 Tax=Candidatus Iainarchaeum sp. TaxID=3101447 RepID=A0A938YTH6_9ARCH|nr:uL15 family ribosomal protein [Candidatus Diapherotrites archaeon]